MQARYSHTLLIFLLCLLPVEVIKAQGKTGSVGNIIFEYKTSSGTEYAPLVVLLPGFTQHASSPEYLIIKQYLAEAGYATLVLNFPQHGSNTDMDAPYSWGKKEVGGVLSVIQELALAQKHSQIHVLGFSIGANIALQIGASPTAKELISSVIAVAAPTRVGEIDLRLSGDIFKPLEGITSSLYAFDRAGLARIAYMIFMGMPAALWKNEAIPVKLVPEIESPTLLLHGADEWLTKSYHSAKMFELANENQQVAFVALDTEAHAEDMLSRKSEALRHALLDIFNAWFSFVSSDDLPASKQAFNDLFHAAINADPGIAEQQYPVKDITMQDRPAFHDFYSQVWYSSPTLNYSVATVNMMAAGENKTTNLWVTLGSTALNPSFLQRFRLGVATQLFENEPEKWETY